MSQAQFPLSPKDLEGLARLGSFVPDAIFDVHAHLYDCSFAPTMATPESVFRRCGSKVTVSTFHELQGPLYGANKHVRLNIVSLPDATMVDLSNGYRQAATVFLKEQLDAHPDCVGEVFVLPEDTVDALEAQLVHPNIKGFKCYHLAAKEKPTWQQDIDAYLPEAAWQVADDRGLCITLHMVKDRALADPGNLAYIQRMCRKYPRARLILAHCARSFAAWTAIDSIRHLADYPNAYVDLSAVCESPAMVEIIRQLGVGRVLWGSDFPISLIRGKCVSVSDGFLWLEEDHLALERPAPLPDLMYVGLENLLAVQQAAYLSQLSDKDIEAIFYDNAATLFDGAGAG